MYTAIFNGKIVLSYSIAEKSIQLWRLSVNAQAASHQTASTADFMLQIERIDLIFIMLIRPPSDPQVDLLINASQRFK